MRVLTNEPVLAGRWLDAGFWFVSNHMNFSEFQDEVCVFFAGREVDFLQQSAGHPNISALLGGRRGKELGEEILSIA